MRFISALAALVLVLGIAVTSPGARAEITPVSHVVQIGVSEGRAVGGGSAQPQFLGGWWKTFKKVMQAIFDFIDGLIDATLPGGGDEGGGDGGMARLAPLPPAGTPLLPRLT